MNWRPLLKATLALVVAAVDIYLNVRRRKRRPPPPVHDPSA